MGSAPEHPGALIGAYREADTGRHVVAYQVDPDEAAALSAAGGGIIRPAWMPVETLADPGAAAGMAIGSDRPRMAGGVPQGLEPNRKLGPKKWCGAQGRWGVVDQIIAQDPVGQTAEVHLALAAQGVEWTARIPQSRDAEGAAAVAAFVEHILLSQIRPGWVDVTGYLMQAALRGFACLEIVPEMREIYCEGPDGAVIWDGPCWVPRLEPRPQRTREAWHPRPGGEWALEQWLASGGTATLEPADMVRLSYRGMGFSPEGRGLLRACYGPAVARLAFRQLEMDGFHRTAYGVPLVHIAERARELYQTQAEWISAVDTVNRLARHLAAGPHSYGTLPSGFSITFADVAFKASDIDTAMRSRGREMAMAVLSPQLYTGDGNGTEALHRSQVRTTAALINGLLSQIGESVSAGPDSLVRQLIRWNLGADAERLAPRMMPSPVRTETAAELVNAITTAADKGLVIPGAQDGAHTRSLLGMPSQTDEQREAWAARAEAEAGAGGAEMSARRQRSTTGTRLRGHRHNPGCAHQALAASALDDRFDGDIPVAGPGGRALLAQERVLRLSEHNGAKDTALEVQARIVEAWRQRNAEPYARALADAGELAAMNRVAPPSAADLRVELRRAMRVVYQRGQRSLELEMDRQAADPALARRVDEGEVSQDDLGTREELATPTPAGLAGALQALGAAGSLVPVGFDPESPSWRTDPGVSLLWRDAEDEVRLLDGAGLGLSVALIKRAQRQLRAALRSGRTLRAMDLEAERDPGAGPPPAPLPSGSPAEQEQQALTQLYERYALSALPRPQPAPGAPESPVDAVSPEQMVRGMADTTARAARNRLQDEALRAAERLTPSGTVIDAAETAAGIAAALIALSIGPDRVQAQEDTNSVFGRARHQQAQAVGAVLAWLSAVMDPGTCEYCMEQDGRELRGPELIEYAVPLLGCEGGAKCRCTHVYALPGGE